MVKERRNFWLEFDIRNHFKLGPVKYHNVVASIKGTKYPDEYVITVSYTHLDVYKRQAWGRRNVWLFLFVT